VGFVATSNVARQLLLEEKSFWSGVSGYFLNNEIAKILNVPPPRAGMLVQYVAKNSPAAQIGLRGGTTKTIFDNESVVLGGDIVLTVQGIPWTIKNYDKIRDVVNRADPGSLITVKILRGGEQLELKAKKDR
jgi:serine protease Do